MVEEGREERAASHAAAGLFDAVREGGEEMVKEKKATVGGG